MAGKELKKEFFGADRFSQTEKERLKGVRVSAPGKLMLFGEHAVVYGYPCLVTAVDQRIIVSVQKGVDNLIEIEAPQVGLVSHKLEFDQLERTAPAPKAASFLLSSLRNFYRKRGLPSGLKIKTKSDFSSDFGFGSSSAVTVATLKALAEFSGIKLSERQLFDLSFSSVLDVQGVGSGFDLAAAIFGGTVYFVTAGKEISPLKIPKLPLVVGYTGVKADTATLVRQVADFRQKNPVKVEDIFKQMALLTDKARECLVEEDWGEAGQLMNTNQNLLELLGVNTPILSNLIESARRAGAYGAKLSGAGGGDCMIALVSEDKREGVEKALTESGGKVLKVIANAQGVKIE